LERLKIGICEDNRDERIRLLGMLTESADDVSVEAYENAEDLLKAFYPGRYDLLILDIFMEGMTGVSALERIRAIDSHVVTAFATTSRDFALESYRLHAARYLEKPVKKEEIEDLLRYVFMKKDALPHFESGTGNSKVRIPFDRILYVEQIGKRLCIHMENKEEVTIRGTLDGEENKFEGKNFYRCHKSYLVNLSKIRSIDRDLLTFIMEDHSQAHISRRGFFAAKRAYEQYLFSIAMVWSQSDHHTEEEKPSGEEDSNISCADHVKYC